MGGHLTPSFRTSAVYAPWYDTEVKQGASQLRFTVTYDILVFEVYKPSTIVVYIVAVVIHLRYLLLKRKSNNNICAHRNAEF